MTENLSLPDKIKAQLKSSTRILDPYAGMVPAFVKVSEAADVNPGLILGALLLLVTIIFVLIQGWTIIITTITVLYPALRSIEAIESAGKDDDKVWLTYWMVFGAFTTIDVFFGFVFYFIPYWDWIRLAFFIWLLLPQFNGSAYLYENIIKKLLKEHKDQVNEWINYTKSAASSAVDAAKEEAVKTATDPSLIAKGLQMQAELAKSETMPPAAAATSSPAKEEKEALVVE